MPRAGAPPARPQPDELQLLAEGWTRPQRRRRNPGPPPRADVRLRPSRDRRRHSCPIDSASGARSGRRDHRFGVPRHLRRPWASGSSVPRTRSAKPVSHSASPSARSYPARLDTVLAAIYAAFTEGWTDPGGTDVVRRDLTEEAMFLARLVTEFLPEEPEALGLLALMLYAEARRRARRQADGDYVPLAEQDPALWDSQMIEEAEALLRRGSALGAIGRYQLEGALQSAHVHRCRTGQPTGPRWCNFTTRSSRSPAHRWWRSIAPWQSPNCMAPAPRPRRHARCSRRRAPRRIPALLGRARRAARQVRCARRCPPSLRYRNRPRARRNPSAASCSSVSPRWRLDPDSKISVEFRRVFAILAPKYCRGTGEVEAGIGAEIGSFCMAQSRTRSSHDRTVWPQACPSSQK